MDTTTATAEISGTGPWTIKVTGVLPDTTGIVISDGIGGKDDVVCARVTPQLLTLAAGLAFTQASALQTYSLVPVPASSPQLFSLGTSDKTGSPSFNFVVEAHAYLRNFLRCQHCYATLGTVGFGSSGLDVLGGLSFDSNRSQNFLTIGLRQVTQQQVFGGLPTGTVLPLGTQLSSITFNEHGLRFFASFSTDAAVLGCFIPIFKTSTATCAK